MSLARQRRHISIVGAGFGALTTIRELTRLGVDAEITLIAPQPELHYLPGSIWIPSGLRRREDLLVPLEAFFRRAGVRHVAAEASGLADAGRRVVTSAGDIDNDALVIACGARFIKKLPGIEHAIIPCQGIAAAESIRQRLTAMTEGVIAVGFAGNPNEPSAVRGGPMFEFLFGIDRQLRNERRRERFQLVFFSPATQPGARLGERAVAGLLRRMQRCGIRTHLGHKLVRFESDKVVTEGGALAADLILFMPGLTGLAWLDATSLPRSPGGFIQADAHCRVPGFERVYAVGDAGSFPGPDSMPKQAHMADLQARAAAGNLAEELAGRPARHGFKVEMICIVDDLACGTLIWRNEQRNALLPRSRALHWAKRFYEWKYLRQYRS